jgi:hypothetical protein
VVERGWCHEFERSARYRGRDRPGCTRHRVAAAVRGDQQGRDRLPRLPGSAGASASHKRAVRTPRREDPSASARRRADRVAAGFLSNITNPTVLVFYLAVLPQFLGPDAGLPVLLAYALSHAALSLV